jgi:hypothetical protein
MSAGDVSAKMDFWRAVPSRLWTSARGSSTSSGRAR